MISPIQLEVIELLAPVPNGLVVDATVGGGGHAHLLLTARPDLRLLGIDRDGDAVAAARERLESFGNRARVVRGGFDDIATIVAKELSGGSSFAGLPGATIVLGSAAASQLLSRFMVLYGRRAGLVLGYGIGAAGARLSRSCCIPALVTPTARRPASGAVVSSAL